MNALTRALLLLATTSLSLASFVPLASSAALERAAPAVGKPAPDFTGTDSNGRTVRLNELHGKTVVLEWSNHDCPFVRKHYGSGNMQALQKEATAQGVVWLTVLSSAPGTQGNVTPAEANALTISRGAAPSAVILDPSTTIAHAYGARTTPHMFVIDKDGILRYMGGIDDKPTTDVADVRTAKNYVRLALAAVNSGATVTDAVTRPYGCSVKYD